MSRWRYFGLRLLLTIPILFLAMTLVFMITRMGPLDPVTAILGPEASGGASEDIRQRLGLDLPLWRQYIDFMVGLLTFDLGQAWVAAQRGTPVTALIAERAPRTIWLGLWAIMLPIFIGVPLGFYAGLRSNTFGDWIASFLGIVWQAMPNFWLGIMLLAVLRQTRPGNQFDFLPDWYELGPTTESLLGTPDLSFIAIDWFLLVPIPTMFDFFGFLTALKQITPAALVLGSALMVSEMRIGRTAVLEQVNANYVETAKAKGLKGRTIVWKHIFRNASIPLVPVLMSEISILIGGSVIIEVVFGINGIGQLFYQAVLQGDLPVAGSLAFVFAVITLFFNVLQDLLYTLIDPRVGFEQ
ncbi:MAG: ABC transporter permease [Halovenus sp.]|uniref:ABC transporter permease n=1 Tax=Halovenus amylolytica TaxID=2500550 RepID=UPI000FE399DF